jgi:hypothetical protein
MADEGWRAARRPLEMLPTTEAAEASIQASLIGALRLRCSRNFEFRDIAIWHQHHHI